MLQWRIPETDGSDTFLDSGESVGIVGVRLGGLSSEVNTPDTVREGVVPTVLLGERGRVSRRLVRRSLRPTATVATLSSV